jgi:hypothetical protein
VQLTSGRILAVEIQNENAEQEWIAKYRAALDESPTKQPPLAKIRAALETAWRTAISRVGHADNKQSPDAKLQPGQLPSSGSGIKFEKRTAHTVTTRAHARSPRTKGRRRRAG